MSSSFDSDVELNELVLPNSSSSQSLACISYLSADALTNSGRENTTSDIDSLAVESSITRATQRWLPSSQSQYAPGPDPFQVLSQDCSEDQTEEERLICNTVKFVLADIIERVVLLDKQLNARIQKTTQNQASDLPTPHGVQTQPSYKIDTGYNIKIDIAGPSRGVPPSKKPSPTIQPNLSISIHANIKSSQSPQNQQNKIMEPLSHDSDDSSVEDLEKAFHDILVQDHDDQNDDAMLANLREGHRSAPGHGGFVSSAPVARPDAVDRPAMVESSEIFPSKSNVKGTYVFGGLPSDSDSDESESSLGQTSSSSLTPRTQNHFTHKKLKKNRVEKRVIPVHGSPRANDKSGLTLPYVNQAKRGNGVHGPSGKHGITNIKTHKPLPNQTRQPKSKSTQKNAHMYIAKQEGMPTQINERPDAVERPILAGADVFPDRSSLAPDTIVFGGPPDVDFEDSESLSSSCSDSYDVFETQPVLPNHQCHNLRGPRNETKDSPRGRHHANKLPKVTNATGPAKRNSHHTQFDHLLKEERRMRVKNR